MADGEEPARRRPFGAPETDWSVVQGSGIDSPEGQAKLASLLEVYSPIVYRALRAMGLSIPEAEDVTKTAWRDGTHTIVLTPHQFMQRLVALVPAPRANLTRYHGVFAPNSKWRKLIVPHRPQEQLELLDRDTGEPKSPEPDATKSRAAASVRPDNYDWATLLRRVFEVDVTVCVDCGGPTKMISAITQPDVIEKILKHLGLPTKPPKFEARGPPHDDDQLQLIWQDDDHVA